MVAWSKEQIEEELRHRAWYKSQRLIEHGIQYTLIDGTPLDWYQVNGKIVVHGKDTQIKREAMELFGGMVSHTPRKTTGTTSIPSSPTRVFIVYGHDSAAREQLELILRRLRLEPIVLQNLPAAGDTIIEKLERLTAADFACVLLTPDDEGHRCGYPNEKKVRAMQDVVLELGMVLAKLGRRNVAILVKGPEIERPSDINGLIYIQFIEHVNEVKDRLAATLQESGFNIQVKDLIS